MLSVYMCTEHFTKSATSFHLQVASMDLIPVNTFSRVQTFGALKIPLNMPTFINVDCELFMGVLSFIGTVNGLHSH